MRQPSAVMSTNVIMAIFAISVIAAAITIGLVTTKGSLAEAYSNATSHQPERYSELYFDNPAQLPSYSATGKPQTIRFHIINHEARDVTYHFQVITTLRSKTTTTDGQVRLANGQGIDETVNFVIPTPRTTANITIALLGTAEQITFRSAS